MPHFDNALGIGFLYKKVTHLAPSGREKPEWVDQHRRNGLAFYHHHHIQGSIFFCFEIHRSNNKATQNWSLFLPATFLPRVILHSVDLCTGWDKVHATDPGHAASR